VIFPNAHPDIREHVLNLPHSRELALALVNWFNTSDATVMAIVDRVDA